MKTAAVKTRARKLPASVRTAPAAEPGEVIVWSPDEVYAVRVAGFDACFTDTPTSPAEPLPVVDDGSAPW